MLKLLKIFLINGTRVTHFNLTTPEIQEKVTKIN